MHAQVWNARISYILSTRKLIERYRQKKLSRVLVNMQAQEQGEFTPTDLGGNEATQKHAVKSSYDHDHPSIHPSIHRITHMQTTIPAGHYGNSRCPFRLVKAKLQLSRVSFGCASVSPGCQFSLQVRSVGHGFLLHIV